MINGKIITVGVKYYGVCKYYSLYANIEIQAVKLIASTIKKALQNTGLYNFQQLV